MPENYQVLLYYKFHPIEDPGRFADIHVAFCKVQGLRGRILIAHEGINGTVSGTVPSIRTYIDFLRSQEGFSDTDFKVDRVDGHVFDKLFVRVRPEIVTMDIAGVDPCRSTGIALDPRSFHDMMQQPDCIILDIRNDYEYELGHFKNAVRPDVRSFKDFPGWIDRLFGEDKSRPLLTYCTGGIRCEKLTTLLLKEGFEQVYQLSGGIVNYAKDPRTSGVDFQGRCYVFDKRISVAINTVNPTVVASCLHCQTACERYVNCAHLDCHRRFFCCIECEKKTLRSCSSRCGMAVHREPLAFHDSHESLNN